MRREERDRRERGEREERGGERGDAAVLGRGGRASGG